MKHWRTELSLRLLVAVAGLACASACSDDSHRQLRELTEVERALSLLRNAPADEKGIRLEQLEAVEVESPQVRKIKEICVESHREMVSAMQALDEARKKTATVESAVADAKAAMRAEDREITAEEIARLRKMSEVAAQTLSGVTENLDRAEDLVEACGAKRDKLRQALTGAR